jgi:hypothetical protein
VHRRAGDDLSAQRRPIEAEVRTHARILSDADVMLEEKRIDRGHGWKRFLQPFDAGSFQIVIA